MLVYDYSDLLVPMLARMYKKRLAGYSALGYLVTEGPRTSWEREFEIRRDLFERISTFLWITKLKWHIVLLANF